MTSTRRKTTTTHHERNEWWLPAMASAKDVTPPKKAAPPEPKKIDISKLKFDPDRLSLVYETSTYPYNHIVASIRKEDMPFCCGMRVLGRLTVNLKSIPLEGKVLGFTQKEVITLLLKKTVDIFGQREGGLLYTTSNGRCTHSSQELQEQIVEALQEVGFEQIGDYIKNPQTGNQISVWLYRT